MFYKENIDGEVIQGNRIFLGDDISRIADKIKGIFLATKDIRDKPVIAFALPRSELLFAAIIAALQSRITFLPLDLRFPKERIDYMLDLAQVNYILTTSGQSYDFGGRNIVYYDQYENHESAPDYVDNQDNEIAYVLFTSGSSGHPKGVEVTRSGLENFLDAVPQIIDFSAGRKIACFTNCTFDIFFLESVLALYQGLSIVMTNEEEQDNPREIEKLLSRHKIDMLQMTPSRLKLIQMIDKNFKCLSNVKTLMVGGEPLSEALFGILKEKTNAEIYNMYGPTETTIWSCISNLTGKESVDIGKPIGGTNIYILSEDLQLAAGGDIGEICIGGKGLAKGYLNNPEQTEKSFCRLPFEPFERIYLTGDLGRYYGENLIFLGRKDEQVKLRGHRIELDGIDANIMRIDGIAASTTCFDTEGERLVNFYISGNGVDFEEKNLRQMLSNMLPEYMIPSRFCSVVEFHYTPSGKIDRKAMLRNWKDEKMAIPQTSLPVISSSDQTTEIVIEIFKGVLEDGNLMITGNSLLTDFEMNSMSYVNIIVQIEGVFGFEVETERLINWFESVNEISQYIKTRLLP
jgi:amino acid adenylation domain-containing protein